MFIKQHQQKLQTRSISNASGHSNGRMSIMPSMQNNTINAIWDINQIGQELDCHDDPILNEALELITNRQVNQAILLLNQMIADGKKYLGQQSQVQVITKVTLLIVSSAMSILENDPASALLLLLGCDQMFKGLTPKQQGYLRVQILNGLGCYYRRVGQMEKALKELECALAVIRKYNLKEVAVTHLNLSVVLSLVEEHEGALENAKKAVAESHKEYQFYIKNHVSMQNFKFQRCVSALAISFYNVGVQEQHFQKYQFALQAYASAFKVAEDNLGIHHYLTIQLKAIYEEFARQLAIAEAQKIAITSLNHKFQIRANVTSQYAQSALRNQNTDTAKKVSDRLFQSETKRLGHSLRPQSAIMTQSQSSKLKAFEITKKEAFTIKKQMSATNRTLNQVSEENLKTDTEIAEKAKALQQDIENLKILALKEQEELKFIQDQKQRELQKLEAFRYMNQQIQQQKLQKNTPQTSREIKKSQEQQKQIFNTDPFIQEQLDDSEPQPLVAVQTVNNRESKTDEEEEHYLTTEKFNEKIKNEINQDYDKKRSSMTRDETLQSFTKKLEYDQESSSKNNFGQQNISCKQIDDLEEIVEDVNEVNLQQNQQIVENKVDEIIQQTANKLNEEQKLQHIIMIQKQWRSSNIKLKSRIQKIGSKYQEAIDHHYIKIKDQNNNLIHNGYLFVAWNSQEQTQIDLIFYDLFTLRKSSRKSNDISQKLDHIFILNLNSSFQVNKQQIIQLQDELQPFFIINSSQLCLSSMDPYIQFKDKYSEYQIRFDFNLLKLEQVLPKIEEQQLNYNTPITIADIQQFNSDSIVVQKAAHTNQDQMFTKVEPFQDVPLVQEQIDEEEYVQNNQNSQAGSVKKEQIEEEQHQNSEGDVEKENSNDERINQTGQFNNNLFSSQGLLSEFDKIEDENQKQKQSQQTEVNQNLDFTLQLNQMSANNSMVGSNNIGEVDNYNQQQQAVLQNNVPNGNKEKVSANNTIIEEDEDDKKEHEVNEIQQKEERTDQNNKQLFNAPHNLQSKNEISHNIIEDDKKSDRQSQKSESQMESQTSIEQKHQTQTLAVPNDDKKMFAKQVSLQLPDLMKDDNSQHSDDEISLTNNYTFEKIGVITGINKNDGSLFQINIFINKEQELFQAKAEDIKMKSTYFKVENIKKTIKKPQKYLKGYIVNWHNENVLKVYTKAHEKAVIKLQKKFKFDHYRRHVTFKLAKSNIEGSLYVGSRKQVIYLAIETKSTQQRNSYTFKNENYSQFVNRISFRVLNNLKYSEEKGIYLLQEPQHRILAQNLQSKIFKLLKPENAFEFIGYGLLNGIYDSVHKKIIIASDNRKTQPSQVDIPKTIQGDQLIQFAQNLLNRSFIIQSNNETCVVYYEEKDEDQAKIIQNKLFMYQTIRKMIINYHRMSHGQIEQQAVTVELQRKLKKYFGISCQNKFYQIGKLSEQQIKNLITNFRRIISTFIIYQNDQVELDIDSIKEFVGDGQFTNLLRMDLKSVVHQI
ncbi:unnamed protein product (macronuclear) [Paramecium tetraurelia]|uniref:Tetratricopeptide repeat protein n=1 Tax=Paramecium tetraurelia TaxID=5888 RepID=A0DAE3_PARTE|nr:uncharacterized protein GSPATT00014917001 [Paramecium tetraurelia]CAK80010.1 unnamed protein product [Paramecium tetraurelia]|eukprot:XP_001447407.1 hypothetical protein (macronuclear) [Paramecium tetraurelia strain d4-2]